MRLLPAGLTVAIAVALVGCTSSDADTSANTDATASASPESTATATGADPLELMGTWHVSQGEGDEPGTVVRIEAGGFEISRDCGPVQGSWVANGTEMRAAVTGWAQTCDSPAQVSWLEDAASYELSAEGLTLRSDDGRELALLLADEALVPDARARDHFAGIVSWPAELEPADPNELWGEWVPPGDFTADPHVVFSDAGRWSGTDGCNGGGGRWILSADGSFDSTSAPSTLVGCDGAPVPTWVMMARGAGMDGDELVLLDIDGAELGRLIRA
jgi:heat shock protein HslJ